ncbi:MAG: glutamate-5-semialdehyde dehydrogenase [Candidatus Omnitrophica bacterium]|nr:glutamate-5-semialdehyde dehydrogenase [Candidatus Omnitrophota bacterium]
MSKYVQQLTREAKISSYKLINLSSKEKNHALRIMAEDIIASRALLLKENAKDLERALKNNLGQSFLDRLKLTQERLQAMSDSLKAVADLNDPVGEIISSSVLANGIVLEKVRVPIGVVLIVYEARPNVTSDCCGLLFKTSNVGILRGGRDAYYSNRAIAGILNRSIKKAGINFSPFFLVEKADYSTVDELLKQNETIDLVIPRGGESLIRKVVETSTIPVIKHYKGVCHIFVDKYGDLKKALDICLNAKVQRPSVCNAVETILVHKDIAKKFLFSLKEKFDSLGVEIRADEKSRQIVKGFKKAVSKDWSQEYLDLTVSLKIVDTIEEAIAHINLYGSHHTESIISKDKKRADKFVKEVDSACCFVNISTRFSDGFEFGLGAEIGISTDKLHARGPMGLKELTTYKWIGRGQGQIRT